MNDQQVEQEEQIISSPINSDSKEEAISQTEEFRVISWEELSQNITRNSLWLIIEGKVYEFTQIIDEFPGGWDVLRKLSGTDATDKLIKIGYPLSRQQKRTCFVGIITNDPMPLDYAIKLKQLKNKNNIQTVKLYTQDEIKQHNKSEDQWINVNGNIYDLSELLSDYKEYSAQQILNGINQNQSQIQSLLRNYQIGIIYDQDETQDKGLTILGVMGFLLIHVLVIGIIKKQK